MSQVFLFFREVHGFHYLSICIARAFGIKNRECVECLQELDYVLTPDFAMKMINICECMECKSPLVISGETGVGKTFLIEAVSRLWNISAAGNIKELQFSLLKKIHEERKGEFSVSIPCEHVQQGSVCILLIPLKGKSLLIWLVFLILTHPESARDDYTKSDVINL